MNENGQMRTVTPGDEAIIDELAMFSAHIAGAEQRCERKYKFSSTSGQGRLLSVLGSNNKMAQKELIRHLHIQPASASELISKLVAKGCVERTRSVNDRRVVLLELTDVGRAEIKEHRDFLAEMIVDLTEEDRRTLKCIIRKLVSSVKSQHKVDQWKNKGVTKGAN